MQMWTILSISISCCIALPTVPRIHIRCRLDETSFCKGTNFNAALTKNYTCGDARLGPATLPTKLPLDALTDIYDTFGGLCPGQFLARWFNTTTGRYNYPPFDGFALDSKANPMKADYVIEHGAVLDRFGSEVHGDFMAPAASPYMQRSLPPSSLDTPQSTPEFPYNYHVYLVKQSFTVSAGPIAPWFGQPGQGLQYKLSETVQTLVNRGKLERIDPN